MKKILALLLAALMVGSMMTGCTKQEATSGEESAQTQQTESEAKEEPVEEETQAAFTGAYIADPEYIKSKIGSEDVIFIDARGADAAKKGTIEGAIATAWQPLARCAEGASGDEMWGTILPLDQLSEVLSSMGITPDKEIILFSDGKDAWGDD